MATTFTLAEYEDADRVVAQEEARHGFAIHAVISLIVSAIVIPINLFVADAFPWSIFVMMGLALGLVVYDIAGVRRIDPSLSGHQHAVEMLATRRHAAWKFGHGSGGEAPFPRGHASPTLRGSQYATTPSPSREA
jgi:hypothetical protein